MKRSEFIRKGIRISIVAGLAGGTAVLVKNNQIDAKCSSSTACKSCSLLSGCTLERAMVFKRDRDDGAV